MPRATRLERYARKESSVFPISLVTTEFKMECNIGQVIRSAVCFGAKSVHVIGSIPEYRKLKEISASTCLMIDIHKYSTPEEFIDWRRNNAKDSSLVSLELYEGAIPIQNLEISLNKETFIAVGHETLGVAPCVLKNSDHIVYIPLPGKGYCLNTGMTAHVALYELTRKYSTVCDLFKNVL